MVFCSFLYLLVACPLAPFVYFVCTFLRFWCKRCGQFFIYIYSLSLKTITSLNPILSSFEPLHDLRPTLNPKLTYFQQSFLLYLQDFTIGWVKSLVGDTLKLQVAYQRKENHNYLEIFSSAYINLYILFSLLPYITEKRKQFKNKVIQKIAFPISLPPNPFKCNSNLAKE